MSVAGLILAAGESKRMGSPKALLEFRGETFLDHLTATLSHFCDPVVVVLGCGWDEIRAGIKNPERAILVQNVDYHLGQLSSMQCGLRVMPSGVDGVLFTLVDHPNVKPSTIAALLAAPRASLAIPRHKGGRGHPIYFDSALIPEFLALTPDSQAKAVVGRHAGSIRYIEVADPGILDDVDDPTAYRRLLETA